MTAVRPSPSTTQPLPQVLQQGGSGVVELSDPSGALRGRVQLAVELSQAAGRLPPSLLDDASAPLAG